MDDWEQLVGASDGSRIDQLNAPPRRPRQKQPFLKRGEGVARRLTAYQRRKPAATGADAAVGAEASDGGREAGGSGGSEQRGAPRRDQWGDASAFAGVDGAADAAWHDAPRGSPGPHGGAVARWTALPGAGDAALGPQQQQQQQQQRAAGGPSSSWSLSEGAPDAEAYADAAAGRRGRRASASSNGSELLGETLMVDCGEEAAGQPQVPAAAFDWGPQPGRPAGGSSGGGGSGGARGAAAPFGAGWEARKAEEVGGG
jgi:hypothetical protein